MRPRDVALKMAAGEILLDEERETGLALARYVGITKDAEDVGDATAIMFYPQGETRDALAAIMPAGNVAPEDLHLTLLYLGEPSEDGGHWDLDMIAACAKLWSRQWGPIDCNVAGIGRFTNNGDTDVMIALVDSVDLANARRSLYEYLCMNCAIPYEADAMNPKHGFIPHITLSYEPKSNTAVQTTLPPDGIEFKIDSIRVGSGDQYTTDFGLGYWYGEDTKASEPEADYASFTYARQHAEDMVKAGRVVSASNMKKIEDAMAALTALVETERKRRYPDDEDTQKAVNADIEGDLSHVVITKGTDEWRYTFGPLYAPNRKDAHGEYVVDSDLHKATINFMQDMVERSDNRLFLQHGDVGEHFVGNIVEMAALPWEHTVKMRTGDGEERELSFPAGTVWIGTLWDEDAWPLVKSGKINGYSMGGRAVRVEETGIDLDTLEHMGDKTLPLGDRHPEAQKALEAMRTLVGKATGADATDEDIVVWVEDLMTKAVAEEKAETAARDDAALELARSAGRDEARREERSLLEKALDLVRSAPVPDLHVHLPEQNVTINEVADDGIEKMDAHQYVPQDDGGGDCKVCHQSKSDGNHVPEDEA